MCVWNKLCPDVRSDGIDKGIAGKHGLMYRRLDSITDCEKCTLNMLMNKARIKIVASIINYILLTKCKSGGATR